MLLSGTPEKPLGCDSFGALLAAGGPVVCRALGRTGVQMGDDEACGPPMLHAAALPWCTHLLVASRMLHAAVLYAIYVLHGRMLRGTCCMVYLAWCMLAAVCCAALHSTRAYCACCIGGKQMTAMRQAMWFTVVERVEEDTVLGHVAAGGAGLDHVLEGQAHRDGRRLACTLRADRLRALDASRRVRWADCEDQR